jgi:beta-lactamase superfamily II metal-dependent hydrolase
MKNKLIILLIIPLLISGSLTISANSTKLKLHFIAVGQGDSILAQLPNQETMLIDAGDNSSGATVTNYLHELRIDKIDYLIGTHPHADHIGGLDDIIQNFTVAKIYLPNVTHTTQTFRDVLLATKRKNQKIKTAEAGMELLTAKNLKLRIKLLAPLEDDYDDLNNYSVVTKLDYANNSFIFTGDAEEKIEDQLVKSSANLEADLLKLAHHGSSSSSSSSFLQEVNPQSTIISVGANNRYNHPADKIINRLKNQQIDIYRTDQQGTIIATSDGHQINFNTQAREVNKQQNSNSKDKVTISHLSLTEEVVTISNNSDQSIDLTDWKLVSTVGQQTFTFPPGTILPAGTNLKVVSGRGATAGPNKIVWTSSYIWNNNGDHAQLYNHKQQLISEK